MKESALVIQTNQLLKAGEFEYAIGGGQAIDLFLGYESRVHGDIDVVVFWKDHKSAALLNDSGRFVLSIDKNQNDTIDTGDRTVKIYPDKPEDIESRMHAAGLQITARRETEFAVLYAAVKHAR